MEFKDFKKIIFDKDKVKLNRNFIAPISIRLIATLFDFILIFTPLYFIAKGFLPSAEMFEGATFFKDLNDISLIILHLFLAIVILISWIFFNGATIGKKLLHIKIVDFYTKEELSAQRYILRYLSYYIYIMPILIPISIGISYFREDNRTLHDLISKTQVISTDKSTVEDLFN